MAYTKLQDFYSIVYLTTNDEQSIWFLKDIQSFWKSHPEFWFSHAPISTWPTYQCMYTNTKDSNVSLLLHYDQIYRHPNPLIQEIWKEYAYKFATQIAFRILHSDQYESCEDWEKVFVLLCIRHNKSLKMKELSLYKALKEVEKTPSSLWLRFLNATIWDVHMYKRDTYGYHAEPTYKDVSKLKTFDSILESPTLHGVAKKIDIDDMHLYDELFECFERCIRECPDATRFAISISGGVDSMVASYIMNKVCYTYKKELILLHICYNNREECEDEINLLRFYSQILERPLYVRSITEMKRCRLSDIRALYEDITRRIRFSFYEYFNCPVILGHNRDDCYENIFSNLSKQIHFDNLFGMSFKKKEQGVTILRPMLSVAKKYILHFANLNDIPHLYDSTPKWSQRGKMRDILIPGIQTFDSEILPGLEEFVKYTMFLEKQWQQSFSEWIAHLKRNEDGFRISRDAFFVSNFENLTFWIRIWSELGLSCRPSNKSFQNLIERLRANQTHSRPEPLQVVLSSNARARILPDVLEISLHSGLHSTLHKVRSEPT